MIRLTDVVHGRNNNFHLLRLLAATAVLFSHSFPLSNGDRSSEPLRAAFGVTPGSVAVDLFFLISGMLVTMSLVRRNDAVDFVRARFFRIWPALTVAVVMTILVLGPAFTDLSLAAYFWTKDTLKYLVFNLFLVKGIAYVLPGVFATNPSPFAVNGSLWTLPIEVKCYVVLLAAWLAVRRFRMAARFQFFVAALWLALFAWHVFALRATTLEDSPPRLALMFCSGTALYLFREFICLSTVWACACLAVLAIAAGHGFVFGITYTLAIPYLMLCLAYLPRGKILAFNRLGDYSYGTYIFAYPIQQSFMHLFPFLAPLTLFVVSLPMVLLVAVLSWHFIEKPATTLARPKRTALASPVARSIESVKP